MRCWMSSAGVRGGVAFAAVAANGIAGGGAAVVEDGPGSGVAAEAGGALAALEDVSLARCATSGGRMFSVPGTKVALLPGLISEGATACSGCAGALLDDMGGDSGAADDAFCTVGGAIASALADLPRKGSRPSAPSFTAKTSETMRNIARMPPRNQRRVCPGVSSAGGE